MPSAMSSAMSSAETVPTPSAMPSAKATLSPKAMPEVPAMPEAGAVPEPEPEPRWVDVHPWSVGRVKVGVIIWGIQRRRSRLVDSRRWRWRHDLFGSRWHRRTRIGWRLCIRIVRSSKLLAVAIPLRLVGPNIAGGGLAPPDGSRDWTCGHYQQPNTDEKGYQSCHMLPVMAAAVTARVPGVREMTAMFKVFAVFTKAEAEPQDGGRRPISTGPVGIRSRIIRRRRIRIWVSIRRHRDRLRRKLFAESHGTRRNAKQKERRCDNGK